MSGEVLTNIDTDLAQRMREAHEAAGQPAEAESIYQQILQQYPRHAPAYHQLGLLLFAQGHHEAVTRFEQAIQLAADHAQYWVSYIDALMLTGQLQKAAAAIQLGQQYGLPLEHAQLLAQECIERMSLDPGVSSADSEDAEPSGRSVEQLWQHACAMQNAGQLEEAKQLLQDLLQVSPEHGEARHAMGRLLAETDSLEAAMPHLEAALSLAPQHEQHWVTYIDALLQLNAFKTVFDAMQAGRKFSLSETMQSTLFADTIHRVIDLLDQGAIDQNQLWTALINDSGLYDQIVQDNLNAMQQAQLAGKVVDGCMVLDSCLSFMQQFPALLESQRLMMFIRVMVAKLMWAPALIGHKIFAPDFDQLLSQITLDIPNITPRRKKRANLVIATEVYDFGGHTKDIIAILNSIEHPVLVITDLYGRFASQLFYQKIASALPADCPVIVLPQEAYLQKSTRLASLINHTARNVFLLTHHDDVVAAVACQPQLETHYHFIHHADHNLAIGNAIPHLKHIDLFGGRAINCHEDLGVETQCLPTTSADRGVKAFAAEITNFGTVTAGSSGKFQSEGPIALAAIVAESLLTTGGKHYHFGEMPQQVLDGLQSFLVQKGLDANRFMYMGNVPSLWDALLEIDAHIFIGSAPIMGAKSDIEAQGAGYPLLAYKALDCPRHMNVGSHAPEALYWHDLASFKAGLLAMMTDHAALSTAARNYYEQACAMHTYQRMLADMSH